MHRLPYSRQTTFVIAQRVVHECTLRKILSFGFVIIVTRPYQLHPENPLSLCLHMTVQDFQGEKTPAIKDFLL